jgi:hypothetical protein
MIAWAIVSGYVLAMLITGRFVYRAMREDMAPDDAVDGFMYAAVSLFAGMLWPFAIPVAIIMWHPKPTSAEVESELAERRLENGKLQRRINELERELGIGAS